MFNVKGFVTVNNVNNVIPTASRSNKIGTNLDIIGLFFKIKASLPFSTTSRNGVKLNKPETVAGT